MKFKIGDLITTYHKGFHRITGIEKRKKFYVDGKTLIGGDLLFYIKEYDANFNPTSRKSSDCCDEIYCKKVNIEEEIEKLEELKVKLLKVKL